MKNTWSAQVRGLQGSAQNPNTRLIAATKELKEVLTYFTAMAMTFDAIHKTINVISFLRKVIIHVKQLQ